MPVIVIVLVLDSGSFSILKERYPGFNCSFLYFLIFIFICLAAPALDFGTWDLCCSMQTLSCSMWDLVARPGIEPGPPALGA